MNSQNKFQVTATDKLGLALSGGGFRAALFHIGVLARMAELDLLRHVQVLSTVSGGSIVGAMYYLKLKQLLEEKRPDGLKPGKAAYLQLVKELEREFLSGVQTNILARTLLNPFKNAKMLLSDDYSRSDRLSELYHETFYKPTQSQQRESFSDWLLDVLCIKDTRAIFLSDLKIYPPGTQVGFDIRAYNKTAEYKVPMLAINATTLNSGELWKFTASSVGVALAPQDNHPIPSLYPQLYFDDPALSEQQHKKLASLTLSDAVAASACVPSLFTPLSIHDLYQQNGEEIVVELVDGGVYDNQGLATLSDESCTHTICSDASGQLQYTRTPSSKLISVIFRSNDILMIRVRGSETQNLRNRPNTGFWHLRDSFEGSEHFPAFSTPVDSSDGISNGQVYLLSAIRTDLDAFTDIEANSLMYDGYCLSDRFLNQSDGLKVAPSESWNFLNIRTKISQDSAKLTHQLQIAGDLFFKLFRLMGMNGRIIAGILALISLGIIWAVLYAILSTYQVKIITLLNSPKILTSMLVFGSAAWFLFSMLPERIGTIKKLADAIRKVRTGKAVLPLVYLVSILTVIPAIIVYIQLKIFNPKYLELGK
ncbi:MAG: patatin family protein [Methylococcaceae bacterium]|nr:patatin family protein [Methylococcaceae bacterium]